jgi:large subunit ribosomal protein L6
MEKKLEFEIEVPEGINVSTEGRQLVFGKEGNRIEREVNPAIDIELEGNKIKISTQRDTKRERKIIGTLKAHINNAIKGLEEKFKYTLQIANVHFPMTVEFDKANNEVIVKNFLGEKKDRKIKVIPGVDININKEVIEVESHDIEKAGQVAANLEKGTKVRNRDRRIFQDGIFITNKPGRSFL